jgi:hypothetical protein
VRSHTGAATAGWGDTRSPNVRAATAGTRAAGPVPPGRYVVRMTFTGK